jgi:metal-sulfur cluster biosynthetic enzyme
MSHRRKEIYHKLSLVEDPELDQPLTELGFISDVTIDDSRVHVIFRLPTYWCSPNFAFLMASGIYNRVKELNWVSSVTVSLKDHCASTEINEGLQSGRPFAEIFSAMADGDLAELRRTFEIKAFLSRQERVLRGLLREGLNPTTILNLTISELQASRMDGQNILIDRYLTKRAELGLPSRGKDMAFIRATGETIVEAEFLNYLREARCSRVSMEFNGSYCQGLLETRYSHKSDLIQIDETK